MMTLRHFIPVLLISSSIFLSAQEQELPRGEIVKKVECKEHAGESYALYLPSTYDPQKKHPILYGFSPGGGGPGIVKMFLPAAERFGWIVVASNNSKNGRDPVPSVSAMWDDTHARFGIDDGRLYASGVSGGSRVALMMVYRSPVPFAGLFNCAAAGLSPNPVYPPPTALVVSFAGTRDYNFGELLQFDRTVASKGNPHRLIPFSGGHSIPPKEKVEEALRLAEVLAGEVGDEKRKNLLEEDLLGARKMIAWGTWFTLGLERTRQIASLAGEGAPAETAQVLIEEAQGDPRHENEKAAFEAHLAAGFRRSYDVTHVRDVAERHRKVVEDYPGTTGSCLSVCWLSKLEHNTRHALKWVGPDMQEENKALMADYPPVPPDSMIEKAAALAGEGKEKEAVACLDQAVYLGLKKPEELEDDPRLKGLQSSPGFAIFAEGHRKKPKESKEDNRGKAGGWIDVSEAGDDGKIEAIESARKVKRPVILYVHTASEDRRHARTRQGCEKFFQNVLENDDVKKQLEKCSCLKVEASSLSREARRCYRLPSRAPSILITDGTGRVLQTADHRTSATVLARRLEAAIETVQRMTGD